VEAAIFSDDQAVTEVAVTELAQRASAVIELVSWPSNERVIVTKQGKPVAVIVSFAAGVEVMLAGSERFTALRREAREELEAGVAEALTAWRIRTKSF
jgi:antitoxin (DNA-binding transcriptional repressor) of toxin-antitoxin stability system